METTLLTSPFLLTSDIIVIIVHITLLYSLSLSHAHTHMHIHKTWWIFLQCKRASGQKADNDTGIMISSLYQGMVRYTFQGMLLSGIDLFFCIFAPPKSQSLKMWWRCVHSRKSMSCDYCFWPRGGVGWVRVVKREESRRGRRERESQVENEVLGQQLWLRSNIVAILQASSVSHYIAILHEQCYRGLYWTHRFLWKACS